MLVDAFVAWLRKQGVDERTAAAYRDGATKVVAVAGPGRAVEQKHVDHVVAAAEHSAADARQIGNLRKIGEVLLRFQAERRQAVAPPTGKPQLTYCARCKMSYAAHKSPEGCPYCARDPVFARKMNESIARDRADKDRDLAIRAGIRQVAHQVGGIGADPKALLDETLDVGDPE